MDSFVIGRFLLMQAIQSVLLTEFESIVSIEDRGTKTRIE